jgi:hypothetical protein
MTLPGDLVQQIKLACESQGLDPEAAVASVDQLIWEDACLQFSVWAGPAWSQETLSLDVYVLGEKGLYNYAMFSSDPVTAVASVTLLDEFTTVSLATIADPRTPYMLTFQSGEQVARVFGGNNDLDQLERFRRAALGGIIEARKA